MFIRGRAFITNSVVYINSLSMGVMVSEINLSGKRWDCSISQAGW